MTSVENLNCPYYHELTISQKQSSFLKVILKIELTLSSWAKFFQKIWQFWWYHLKFELPFIITSWNFHKNTLDLMKWLEYCKLPLLSQVEIFAKIRQFWWYHLKIWTVPVITSWIFCKSIPDLMNSFEHLNCPHYHEV